MITFLAPAWRCLDAVAVSRKMPVDSTTTPTPSSFHGSAAGSFWAQTRTSRPLTKMASPLACTSAARAPWTESCLSRCASVLASARSLTPTTSMSFDSRAVRKKTRPMRPNPLTPTRMLMEGLLVETADRRSQQLEPIIRPLSGHGQPSGRRYGRRPDGCPCPLSGRIIGSSCCDRRSAVSTRSPSMSIRVGVNGFGRIGRVFFRTALESKDIEVVGVNDLADAKTLAHLLKHDSVHGALAADVQAKGEAIFVNGREVRVCAQKDPAALPWKELGVGV